MTAQTSAWWARQHRGWPLHLAVGKSMAILSTEVPWKLLWTVNSPPKCAGWRMQDCCLARKLQVFTYKTEAKALNGHHAWSVISVSVYITPQKVATVLRWSVSKWHSLISYWTSSVKTKQSKTVLLLLYVYYFWYWNGAEFAHVKRVSVQFPSTLEYSDH